MTERPPQGVLKPGTTRWTRGSADLPSPARDAGPAQDTINTMSYHLNKLFPKSSRGQVGGYLAPEAPRIGREGHGGTPGFTSMSQRSPGRVLTHHVGKMSGAWPWSSLDRYCPAGFLRLQTLWCLKGNLAFTEWVHLLHLPSPAQILCSRLRTEKT